MNLNEDLLEKLQKMYTNLLEDEPEDGPFSRGNYDDCYNDGFESGAKDGQLEILKLLFE